MIIGDFGGFDFGGGSTISGGGDRMGLLSAMNSGGGFPWDTLVSGGLSILNNFLNKPTTPTSFLPGGMPTVGTTAAMSAATLIPLLVAAGARVVGNVVRISRAAYAALSPTLKAAIVAVGMSVLIDDATDGSGGLIRYGSTGRRRRAKGITGTELRGFRKMSKLLRKEGMRPKAIGGGTRRKCK